MYEKLNSLEQIAVDILNREIEEELKKRNLEKNILASFRYFEKIGIYVSIREDRDIAKEFKNEILVLNELNFSYKISEGFLYRDLILNYKQVILFAKEKGLIQILEKLIVDMKNNILFVEDLK